MLGNMFLRTLLFLFVSAILLSSQCEAGLIPFGFMSPSLPMGPLQRMDQMRTRRSAFRRTDHPGHFVLEKPSYRKLAGRYRIPCFTRWAYSKRPAL